MQRHYLQRTRLICQNRVEEGQFYGKDENADEGEDEYEDEDEEDEGRQRMQRGNGYDV